VTLIIYAVRRLFLYLK